MAVLSAHSRGIKEKAHLMRTTGKRDCEEECVRGVFWVAGSQSRELNKEMC